MIFGTLKIDAICDSNDIYVIIFVLKDNAKSCIQVWCISVKLCIVMQIYANMPFFHRIISDVTGSI